MKQILYFGILSIMMFMFSCNNNKPAELKPQSQEEVKSEMVAIEQDKSLSLEDRVNVDSPTLNARLSSEDFQAKIAYVGTRLKDGEEDSIKIRFFIWDKTNLRGYYHPLGLSRDVPFFGLLEGDNFVLKTKAPNYLEEDGITIKGTFRDDGLSATFHKGLEEQIATMDLAYTQRKYQLIFYETKIIE